MTIYSFNEFVDMFKKHVGDYQQIEAFMKSETREKIMSASDDDENL